MEAIKKNLRYFIQQENSVGILQISHLRTIEQLNDRLRNINDLYSLYNFIEDLSNNIAKYIYGKDDFFKYVRRLLECISYMLQKYAFDASRYQYLIDLLGYIQSNWKKAIYMSHKQTLTLNKNILIGFKFRINKNECMFYTLKAFNFLMQKQLYKMINNESITIKSLLYIKKRNVNESWQNIYLKMKKIFSQSEEQTDLKIDQLNEFLKHTLFQVNFCLKKSDFEEVYLKFFQISGNIFRLIKKFYSKTIIRKIQYFKSILLKGLLIYKQINQDDPSKQIKLTNLINLIKREFQRKKQKRTKNKVNFILHQKEQEIIAKSQSSINPKAYAIKLAFHLLNNWKKIKNQKNKIKNRQINQKLRQTHIQEEKKWQIVEKRRQIDEVVNFKIRTKGRIHRTMSVGRINNNGSDVLNKIHLRNQIQNVIHNQFKKLDYLNHYKVGLIQKKNRSNSVKNYNEINNEERQLKLQQYKQKLNMGRKIIVASKSIQLYKPEKHDMVLHSQKIGKISMQYKQNAFGRKTLLKL